MPDLSIPNTSDNDNNNENLDNQQQPGAALPDPATLVGQEVYGAYGNLLGTVTEVRDHPNGSTSYLIIDDADQDLYRPVPYSIFTHDGENRMSTFYSAWRFNQSPGYTDIADIPAFDAQPNWDGTVREYWGLPNADQ